MILDCKKNFYNFSLVFACLFFHNFFFQDHWNKLEITPCEDNMPVFDVAFDSDKCLYSSVENSQTVTHESGERGYALANTAVTSGCYQWKFLIVKENKGNEGTCVGVAKWPIKDYSHRTTSDMWLYRAYR